MEIENRKQADSFGSIIENTAKAVFLCTRVSHSFTGHSVEVLYQNFSYVLQETGGRENEKEG